MENYTNPEQAGQEQNPQDLLNSAIIFAKALGLILNENEGVVVDVTSGIELPDEVSKIIVFKNEEQIKIYKCEEDLPEGTAVNMNTDEAPEEPEETKE